MSRWSKWMVLGGVLLGLGVQGMPAAGAQEEAAAMARGGRLYDKWYEELDVAAPEQVHPAYPASGGYANKPADTWRCKECHGWDYRGREGAYATGKHATGIVGIDRLRGGDPAAVVALLKDANHRYGERLGERELGELALFVTRGQVEMEGLIERATKRIQGDARQGAPVYDTICARCHGEDGMAIKGMKPMGHVATDNPWETLHKVLNGEPGSKMPALRALDHRIALDTAAHAATLPTQR